MLFRSLGLWPAAYKDVARVFVHLPAAPLDVVIPDTPKCAVVLGRIKAEPSVAARWAAEP